MTKRPIFQMCLNMQGSEQGWVFPGEKDAEGVTSPVFTIAWRHGISMTRVVYFMPGEIKGEPAIFKFVPDDGKRLVLQHQGVRIDLSVDSGSSRKGFRYIGRRSDVLEWYGKNEEHNFVAVVPTNLKELDRLYTEHRVVLVGITLAFGLLSSRELALS